MSELGDKIRSLRGKESLRDVSKRAGISHNYLSIIEKGIDPRSGSPVQPYPDTLKRLAKAFNYPYEELLAIAGIIDEEYKQQLINEKKLKFVDAIFNLPEDEQKLIKDMVNKLNEKP